MTEADSTFRGPGVGGCLIDFPDMKERPEMLGSKLVCNMGTTTRLVRRWIIYDV
jgi:hypothetical protein